LSSKINLANDQFDMNLHREAQRSDEEAWNGLQAALSPDNPDTLAAAGNLAVSLRTNGEVARAEELQADTLRRAIRMVGGDHPNVASIASWRRLNCDISPPPI